jgi:hypothetical protein
MSRACGVSAGEVKAQRNMHQGFLRRPDSNREVIAARLSGQAVTPLSCHR